MPPKYSIIYMELRNMPNENFIFYKIYLEFMANFLNNLSGFHKFLWRLGSNEFKLEHYLTVEKISKILFLHKDPNHRIQDNTPYKTAHREQK